MNLFYTILGALMLSTSFGFGQNQSMTIAHSGISPNDTLWVTPGEQIDFIYGSGGNHPMTSGQGSTSSPIFFPTITVNSSIPLVTFSLTTVGTYIFHCGTNPGNTDNWGTIIVEDVNSIEENTKSSQIKVFPNPTTEILTFAIGSDQKGDYQITDQSGKIVLSGMISSNQNSISIAELEVGHYQCSINIDGKVLKSSFIKN